jgi:hypothetical protein
MGFLRRDRRTLNERLLDNLRDESRAHAARFAEPAEPQIADDEVAVWERGYWDVVVEAEVGGLREDSYEFASLASGDLVVEENVEESLSALADAVDLALESPYRAVAVRQGRESWSISARRIEVVPLDVQGELVRLVSSGGELALELDWDRVENHLLLAALAEQALGLGDDYVVDASYLDDGLWELRAERTDPASTTTIDASREVVDHVLENGGKVYIWLADSAPSACGTEPPEGVEFVRLPFDGFEAYQDTRITPPRFWKLILPAGPPRSALERRRLTRRPRRETLPPWSRASTRSGGSRRSRTR